MKFKNIVLLVLLSLVLILSGCNNVANKADDEEINYFSTNEEVFLIETPYCKLFYPSKWEDKVNIETVQYEDGCIVEFDTVLNEEKIDLFDVVFEREEGVILGTLNYNGKEIKVSMITYDDNLSAYDDENRLHIGEMCDDINVIISKLVEEYDFVIAA